MYLLSPLTLYILTLHGLDLLLVTTDVGGASRREMSRDNSHKIILARVREGKDNACLESLNLPLRNKWSESP